MRSFLLPSTPVVAACDVDKLKLERSAKDIVGCALGPSRVWFTLGFGIVNEVYYPRIDIPQIRDLGFIVSDGAGFWVELRRHGDYAVTWQDGAIPAITIAPVSREPLITCGYCQRAYGFDSRPQRLSSSARPPLTP